MRYILIGAGGHAKVIVDILLSTDQEIIGFIDDNIIDEGPYGLPFLGTTKHIEDYQTKYPEARYIVAIGDNGVRESIVNGLKGFNVQFGRAIHSTAVIGSDVCLGDGCVVMPNVVVNAGTIIGEHAILNTASTIDHECKIGSYSHISPGVHLAGGVTVGSCSHIGIGVSIIQGMSIGTETVIGAGACVVNNIPDKVKAVGCPAKVINTLINKG